MTLNVRRIAPVAILIAVSVVALVSIGEGFKYLRLRREGLEGNGAGTGIRKRQAAGMGGSTLTFSMPW